VSAQLVSNVVGFDDAPFDPSRADPVKVVGAVYAGHRLDGVLVGQVQRDGLDATDGLRELVAGSRFRQHIRLLMLQGIAFGGFNVVDAVGLGEGLGIPVLVVARSRPDMEAVRQALLQHVSHGARKWKLIERLGPMEPTGKVFVQRVGLTRATAARTVEYFTLHGHMPEPLRVAHLIAGALTRGQSRGRA
jgi:endonuclease V-like protein UPF0215 family